MYCYGYHNINYLIYRGREGEGFGYVGRCTETSRSVRNLGPIDRTPNETSCLILSMQHGLGSDPEVSGRHEDKNTSGVWCYPCSGLIWRTPILWSTSSRLVRVDFGKIWLVRGWLGSWLVGSTRLGPGLIVYEGRMGIRVLFFTY